MGRNPFTPRPHAMQVLVSPVTLSGSSMHVPCLQSEDPVIHRRAQGTPAQDADAEVDAVLKHLAKVPVVRKAASSACTVCFALLTGCP